MVEPGNIQKLHITVGDQPQTVGIHEVQAIQFGVSLPPEPAPTAAAPALKAGAAAPADALILKDGTHVASGRILLISIS